jgi:hypothetical protein
LARAPVLPMLRYLVVLLVALPLAMGGAEEREAEQIKFDKKQLEAIMKEQHSDKVSNIYDAATGTQFTWNVQKCVPSSSSLAT